MPSSMHDCTNRNNLKYLLASNDVHFPTSQNYSKWILISVFEGRSAGEILKRESRPERIDTTLDIRTLDVKLQPP